MIARSAVGHLQDELAALEHSVERAGVALGCAFSSHGEFEAAVMRTDRYWRAAASHRVSQFRTALAIVAGGCLLALVLLVF